jgi:hypothetical protein
MRGEDLPEQIKCPHHGNCFRSKIKLFWRAATGNRCLKSPRQTQSDLLVVVELNQLGHSAARRYVTRTKASRPQSFAAGVGRALRRAAKDAQKTARTYGTPLYVWENGKVVAKKP